MKILLKIIKRTFIALLGIVICLILTGFVYFKIFYVQEMNEIKDNLNEIENVELINIWGNEDVTLENISARILVKNKGEIVLHGLSEDSFKYPKRIPIEIEGYSFISFSCNGGIGSTADIGTDNELGNIIGKEFHTVEEIVKNYDIIISKIETLKLFPEINHFETENNESYLLIRKVNTNDIDPTFNLNDLKSKFDFAKTLKWNRVDCHYNRPKCN